ncbi:MAG: hypothetical protein H0X11_12660 [Betaproteobacteria bacterium]|jgi:uncharacterized protein (TIGR02588 family)|nr:hypothetical protein [Betaproteobacteria bacterium]HEV8185876.1 hypothetical protein [Chthoniobacterales bacterium]
MKKIEKNWLEWLVFGVSAALISTVIGFLAYESVTMGEALPDIQLQTGIPEARTGYYAVPLQVTNKGDQTAEGVHIEVVLRIDGREERSDIEIAFLPRRGAREAWVTFKSDAHNGALEARVLGYEKP